LTVGLRTLADLGEVAGAHVFVRVDFNVPMHAGEVTDDTRIRAAVPTIRALLGRGATLVLGSHLGRPAGERRDDFTLAPVAHHLVRVLNGVDVVALGMPGDDGVAAAVGSIPPGGVGLLENLRFDPGEEANDPRFAGTMAELVDAYVDDAFGAVHRAHASVVALPELLLATGRPAVAGRLLQREVEVLGALLDEPERPFVAVLGGAKVSDKLGVIDALIERVDTLLIGGAMAFTLLAAEGASVGRSLVERERLEEARTALAAAAARAVRVELPVDVVAAAAVDAAAPTTVVDARAIPDDLLGLDIGPRTVERFAAALAGARTIFWNGPMGVFELPPFSHGTSGVARAAAAAAEGGAFGVVGGGDSLAAVAASGLGDSFDHLSTGGGAALEFLEGRTLPGIAILEDRT